MKTSLKNFLMPDFGKIIVFAFLLIVFNLIISYNVAPCEQISTEGFFCQYYKLHWMLKLIIILVYLFLLYLITCLIKLSVSRK